MIIKRLSLEAMITEIDKSPNQIGLEQSNALGSLLCVPDPSLKLTDMDPFTDDYAAAMRHYYEQLSGRNGYNVSRDELSNLPASPNPWTGVTPFTFPSSIFVGDFIEACGSVLKALCLTKGQNVLEYGFGSGQALLMLARMGIHAHGVDIDPGTIAVCQDQANAMGLDVRLQQEEFGNGFDGQLFDGVFFFEAFHHAFDFKNLLVKLHDKITPSGKIVFAGEPIVEASNPIVPYPWGLRLDGLSMYCIRKYGWMELGFQRDFFTSLLMSAGWKVTKHPHPSFRAVCYVAEPIGDVFDMRGDFELPPGWSEPETNHRWTAAEETHLPLPWMHRAIDRAAVTLGNHLPGEKRASIKIGENTEDTMLEENEVRTIDMTVPNGARRIILNSPLTPVEGGKRKLGVAVKSVRYV